MNRNERMALLILALLLLLGGLFWVGRSPRKQAVTPPVVPAVSSTTVPVPTPQPSAKPSTLSPAVNPNAPAPPAVKLHKELIPKDITIVRCYYTQEIVPPGVTFGFDINGSGFTMEFQKMIKLSAENPHIRIKNLRLVTANQIHGDMEVGPDAATAFVYPRVLIKGLPVFSAPEPFAVVRKGEVLTIIFISMEESGHAGRFRVITNLDDELFKQFHVEPSTPGLEISAVEPHLPYAVEGTLRIGQRLPQGAYTLLAFIGKNQIYRREGMVQIVRPNVGQTGFVQGVMVAEPYHRPGDLIQLYVQGTGLSPQDVNALNAKVDEFDMGQGSFTYISGVQLRLSFACPAHTLLGSYGVTIGSQNGQTLFQKKDAFKIIPPNWIAGVQVNPPVKPGQKSLLKILGRDLSADFAQNIRIELDDPGISIQGLHAIDLNTLAADIVVSSSVAPGDYWLHLSVGARKIEPPYGSIIKVERAF